MKYTSCSLIEHGLDFSQNSINLCCRHTSESSKLKEIISDYNGELLNIERFFALKRYHRKRMKEGNILPECRGCIYLEEKEYDDEDYIDTINFNHGNTCNCKCVYCPITIGEKSPSRYNVYDVIKHLADGGYIRKGGHISIAGGEPVIAPEFNDLLTLFLELDLEPIRILTNSINYSDIITKGVQKGNVNILTSVDAGTPEMYRWIKGVDCFKFVWDNLKTYAENQSRPYLVKAKYLVIPTINDIKDEVLKFLDKAKECGLSYVTFDIEQFWFEENRNNIPNSLNKFLEFTVEETQKRGLVYDPIDRAVILLKEINKTKNYDLEFRGNKV